MLEYFRFKEIHDLYAKGKVDEARYQLSELQARYVNLCDENSMLRTQIQGYEDILYLSRSLIFDGIFYWLITGSIKQGPFCPTCYNRDGLLLRLSDDGRDRQCLACGSTFARSASPQEDTVTEQYAVSGMAQGEPFPTQRGGYMDEPPPVPAGPRRKATIIPFSR